MKTFYKQNMLWGDGGCGGGCGGGAGMRVGWGRGGEMRGGGGSTVCFEHISKINLKIA